MQKTFLFCFLSLSCFVFSQKTMQGQVIDFDTTVPVAFAKISYNNTTFTSDWEGKFTLDVKPDNKPIFVTYKGYYDKSYYLTKDAPFLMIKMVTNNTLKEQEVYSENQVNLIIKKVITSKDKTQPEKALKSFQYKNYEHILVSADPKSISSKIDTIIKRNIFGKKRIKIDSSNYKFKRIIEKQHLYQTEKVNLIQHNKSSTKETIIATRMAGFKQPLYEYLGLKLVSYSLYDNNLDILEIPIQNPISKVGRKLFVFKIIDTLKIDDRKVFRIYFQPKKLNSNNLRGLLYIDCENFAVAKAFFRVYGIVNINATYTYNYIKENKIWFPKKRKILVIKGKNSEDLKILGGTIKFNSSLDSEIKNDASDQVYLKLESTPYDVEINKPISFKNPQIKIDVPATSISKPDKFWNSLKKDSLDVRRIKTYSIIDSLSVAENIEKKLFKGIKIINGYFPVSFIDIDLRSIVKYNNFEGFRLGFGGVTNNKLSEKYKIGGYIGYGFKDDKIKYGITPSYLLNKETNTWVSASYSDDLSEIGQIQFATQSRRFKVYDPRPINISTFYNYKSAAVFLESKYIPKVESYFGLSRSEVRPLFDYTYVVNEQPFTDFKLTTALLSLQWNPFSSYMQTPSGRLEVEKKFPKFSFQITKTLPSVLGNEFNFTKIDFKINQDVPYLSGQKSSFIFQTGIGFGDIPLTHLYSIAPNNLTKDGILKRITFAGKNSFETMYFNEFFSSKYATLQARHTFNKVKLAYKIKPLFSIVTRFAVGSVEKPEQHQGFEFKTLEKGFIESGVEANQIYKGFGLTCFYRYGPNGLARFDDNLAVKISFILDLGI